MQFKAIILSWAAMLPFMMGCSENGGTPDDVQWEDQFGLEAADPVGGETERQDASDPSQEEVVIVEHGECTTIADCGGLECLRLPDLPGGYRLCKEQIPAELTQCTDPGMDECCSSADCTAGDDGGCHFFEDVECAGGGPTPDHNQCFYTQCRGDSDCPAGWLCLPSGAKGLPRNTCVRAWCETPLDCTESQGAYCKPMMELCCPAKVVGFFCINPARCESLDDCDEYFYCAGNTSTGWAECTLGVCAY